jgi:hypothetical protein
MAQCEFCGAATSLYDSGSPICIECSNRRDAGERLTKVPRVSEPGLQREKDELLENLRIARDRYFDAKRQAANAVSQRSEIEHADGCFAMNQTIRNEMVRKYTEALNALAEFARRQKSPKS